MSESRDFAANPGNCMDAPYPQPMYELEPLPVPSFADRTHNAGRQATCGIVGSHSPHGQGPASCSGIWYAACVECGSWGQVGNMGMCGPCFELHITNRWDATRDGVPYIECDTEYQAGELPITISRSVRVF